MNYELISHSLRHLDAQQAHTVLNDLRHILRQHKTEEFLLLIGLVENRVVVTSSSMPVVVTVLVRVLEMMV